MAFVLRASFETSQSYQYVGALNKPWRLHYACCYSQQVYKAKRHGATVVAIKILKVSEDSRLESAHAQSLEREVEVLYKARHPHIVTYFGLLKQVSWSARLMIGLCILQSTTAIAAAVTLADTFI